MLLESGCTVKYTLRFLKIPLAMAMFYHNPSSCDNTDTVVYVGICRKFLELRAGAGGGDRHSSWAGKGQDTTGVSSSLPGLALII